jgi:hypothetical protein
MTKTNWVIKNADKKDFVTVSREVAHAHGIAITQTSTDLLNMGKSGIYMFLNKNTDKFDFVGKTTESFSRRVNENVSDYPRFASFMKHIKTELRTSNTRKAVKYITDNYNVVILPMNVRRSYDHQKKVDRVILWDLEKNLINKFMPKFNKKHNPMYAKRQKLVG